MTSLRNDLAVLVFCLLSGLQAGAAQPAPAAVRFDVAELPMEQALTAFASQADLRIIFFPEAVRGLKGPRLTGTYTPQDALKLLLANTELRFRFTDARTVSVTSALRGERSATPSLDATAAGGLQLASAAAQGETDKAAATAMTEEPVHGGETQLVVTGSRIRSLLGEASFSPMLVFSRADIERAGVTSVGELSRLIPQAYSQGSYDGIGFGGQSRGMSQTSDGSQAQAVTTTRSTFNLRGLGTQNTLVLVNGRRLARTGTIRGDEGVDLAGIPVSAIERIEVLTDGASAIYGSDAVGGVINLILRTNYSGTEANVTYENTFDSDTAARTATLAHSFTAGKLSGSVSGTFQDRNAFAAVDRYFSATNNWVALGGTSALAGGVNSFGSGGIVLGAGLVQAASGNLPGRTSPFALIPAGASGALRPAADYISVPTAGTTAYAGDRALYTNIISPQTNKAASVRLSYPLTEGIGLFADARYSQTLTPIEGMPVNFRNALVVPANYPGNPFGVAVRLNKTFWELENLQSSKEAKTANTSFAGGISGRFGKDWRYEAAFDWNRGLLRDSDAYDPVLDTAAYNAAIAAQSLVLFYDSRTVSPNNSDLMLSFLRRGDQTDRDVSMGVSVSVDGAVWELPAGAVRVALGAERRRDSARLSRAYPENPLINSSLLGSYEREIDAGYAEVRVPVISAKQDIPLINRFDLTAAIRHDRYSDIGSDTSPRYGMQWRPVSWLMLRGTRNQAFRAPNLHSLYRPVTDSDIFLLGPSALIDRQRNNQVLSGFAMPIRVGGNADLRPEHSVSTNMGAVLELPFRGFEGLSLAADFIDIHYTDRIGDIGAQLILDLFPERVTRGANLPGDPSGMPGPITQIDTRSFNIAQVDIRSMDYQINYTRSTDIGTFDLRAAATVYDEYESRSLPTATVVPSSFQFPTRYTWQSYWSRGPLGLGISGFYQDLQYTSAARTLVRFENAVEWNLQMAYDFGAAGFSRLLADTRFSFTVFNVLDREPPHIQGRAGFAVTDPRMRRYAVSLQKSF